MRESLSEHPELRLTLDRLLDVFFSCSQTCLVVRPFWEDEVIEKDQRGSGVSSFHFISPSYSPATIFVFMKSGPVSQIPVNYTHLSPPASIPDDVAPGKRSRSSRGSSWKSPSVPGPAFCFATSRVLSQGFCSPWSPHLLASGRDKQMAEKYKRGALDQESRELWSNPSSILPELCDLDQMTVPFLTIGFLDRNQTWVLKVKVLLNLEGNQTAKLAVIVNWPTDKELKNVC